MPTSTMTPATTEEDVVTPPRTAERVIALACIAIVVVLVAQIGIYLSLLNSAFHDTDDVFHDGFVQAGCLTYNGYVLERANEGLTADQIEKTVQLAGAHRRGDWRVDSPDACGTPAQVLAAAGVIPKTASR